MENIEEKFQSLNDQGVNLGEATTEETQSTDGMGVFKTYENGTLYYSPDTGACLIQQPEILTFYQDSGAETGDLRYPTSDEEDFAENDATVGRQVHFQFGDIVWRFGSNQAEMVNSSTESTDQEPTKSEPITFPELDSPIRTLGIKQSLHIINKMLKMDVPPFTLSVLKTDDSKLLMSKTAKDSQNNDVTHNIVRTYQVKPGMINNIQFRSKTINPIIDNLDPRMILFLYKFTQWFNDTWGPANNVTVTEIHHLGIGHGNEKAPFDCHNTGRAIDLAGIAGTDVDGNIFTLNVLNDWGKKKAKEVGGKFFYRLTEDDGLIYNFGLDVYKFAIENCQDKDQSPYEALSEDDLSVRLLNDQDATIGSFVLYPDMPHSWQNKTMPDGKVVKNDLHADHQNHFHIQIGKTGFDDNPLMS